MAHNEFVSEFRAYAKKTDDRLERLEKGYQRLEEDQRSHTNDIDELKGNGLETKLYNRGVTSPK